jgi:hypothetical protein
LGEHDVAIPYSQISWMYQPAAQPVTTGAARTVGLNSGGAHPSADKALLDAASARPYPDHAVINTTKDQLKAAPACTRPVKAALRSVESRSEVM